MNCAEYLEQFDGGFGPFRSSSGRVGRGLGSSYELSRASHTGQCSLHAACYTRTLSSLGIAQHHEWIVGFYELNIRSIDNVDFGSVCACFRMEESGLDWTRSVWRWEHRIVPGGIAYARCFRAQRIG
jgi:hypothetical protein